MRLIDGIARGAINKQSPATPYKESLTIRYRSEFRRIPVGFYDNF